MARFNRIFDDQRKFVEDVPWIDDGNGGLPDWYFSGIFTQHSFFSFEIDLETDTIEWVPAMGPAPIWKAQFSMFKNNDEILKAWDKWYLATY